MPAARTTQTTRTARATPAERRTRRRAVLLGTAGAALAATVLASTLAGSGSGPAPTGVAAPPAVRAPAALTAPTAEPETCEDGSNPAASLRPSGASGPKVEQIRDRGRLVVGVDQNSYLWGYRDPQTGDIVGFDIDLVKAIAEDLLGDSSKVTYRTIPTDQRIPAIRSGEVDMVVRTMTVNCERLKEVSFSTSYFTAGQQLLVPQNSTIEGLDETVRGKRVCRASGSTAEKLLEGDELKGAGIKPVTVANQLDCLVRLQLGEADAVLTDNALAAGQAAQDPSVRVVGEPATVEPYGVAMKQEDEDLIRRVNKVLEDYRGASGEDSWRGSYERWLADVLEDSDEPPAPLYRD